MADTVVRAYSVKQKKWVDVKTAKDIGPDVASSMLASAKEHLERDAQHVEQIKDLEQKNLRLQSTILCQVRSLVLERIDLQGRMMRIDQRIQAMGFEPQKAINLYGSVGTSGGQS